MNALQEFRFDNAQIRLVLCDETPYWCAKDVCEYFGDTNHQRSVSRIDDEDKKQVQVMDTLGRFQTAIGINESGLYNLLFSFQPEKATKDGGSHIAPHIQERIEKIKRFRKWVTSEVLPQIRKTGSYSLPSDPHDQVLMLCDRLKAMTIEAKQLTQKIIEQQPAVDAWKTFMDADGLIDMVYVAQTCGVGKNRLYRKLREEKVFHYDSDHNAVYQQYVDRGYFDVRFVPVKNIGNIPVIRCTTKGAEWIFNKFYRKAA